MKQLSTLCLLLAATTTLLAQQPKQWLKPCGTPSYRSEWLKAYQRNPEAHRRSLDTLLHVPLTIHLVGSDEGAGFFELSSLKKAMCKLNEDFAPANIQFFIAGDINYIANSAYNVHDTVLTGAEMMFANNVENTLNVYFVGDPAGNCGYNLPYAGVAMSRSCSGANSDTWAHEMGHALSVQHPFLGWEGGVSYDGSVNHNYENPAPTTVTYNYTNFKDTLILDTLIIDTAQVELMDGSNCTVAGDGFCDTRPDYLGFRWNCNQDGESSQLQTDPNGVTFRSDGSLIMGYANDACQSRFTEEQIAAMRANLYEEKPEVISNQPPLPTLSDEPIALMAPEDGSSVQFDDVTLEWEAIEGAATYIVETAIVPTFVLGAQEHYTDTNQLTLTGLDNNRTYYWRVTAYNRYSFCAPISETGTFHTEQLTAAASISSLTAAKLFPNPANGGGPARLALQSSAPLRGYLELRHLSGQLLRRQGIDLPAGEHRLALPVQALPAGFYTVQLLTPQGRWVEKLTIQR